MLLQHKHYITSITEAAVTCLQSYYDRKLINNLCTDNLIQKKRKKEKGGGEFLNMRRYFLRKNIQQITAYDNC